MLVLAATCAVPGISAAQELGTTTDVTTTPAAPPATPVAPGTPGDGVPTPPASADAPPASADAPPAGTSAGSTHRTSDVPSEDGSAASGGVPAAAPAAVASGALPKKAHAAASASVTIGDFFFSPSSVTVAVGDTVTWTNTGDAPHNATADDGSFSTPDLNKGQSASHQFTSAGTFSYICTIHPNMHGTVRVLSSGSGGGGSGGSGSNSGVSGTTEASAVASPNAAGDSNTLPMTGMAAGGLALVGLALLGSGLLVRGAVRRWLTPF
jgi:plastocyanin